MNTIWLFLTTILYLGVTGQDTWGLLHFSKWKYELIKCIEEDEFFMSDEMRNHEDIEGIRYIIELIADKYYRSTKRKEEIANVPGLVNVFRGGRYYRFISNRIPWAQLEQKLQTILLKCSDDYDNDRTKTRNMLNVESNFSALPHFIEERSGVDLLLDYM